MGTMYEVSIQSGFRIYSPANYTDGCRNTQMFFQETIESEENIYNSTDFCDGIMRPCITFFGEKIHSNVNRLLQADRKMADALIVIGTSLSV